MIRLCFLLFGLLLAACTTPPLPTLPDRRLPAAVQLAPFEEADQIPPQIARLPFDDGRAYAILVQIPAPAVVDLSDPDRARRGLLRFLDPLASVRAGTLIGHTMAGWRCADGTLGLASKSGDDGNVGLRMVLRGWGIAAFLSDYADGHLYEPAQIPDRHRRVLRQGRARILAVEIDEAGCQAIRRALVRYRSHPDTPERHFSMLRDPAALQGDGCAEFALWLLGQGGAFVPVLPELRRPVPLRDSFVGLGRPVSGPVTPFRLPGLNTPVPLARLLRGDWSAGRMVGQVEILDLELLRVLIDRAYARTGPVPPRLAAGDTQAQRVAAAADRWLARTPRTVPARIGAARAVVLSRR
ncbi:MAG: hypothetical protein H6898_01815 [Rhodobacter sp.]|nr:hypothetical protein [Paracoccaceae bacterium]MCC0075308.1 hypothetical protein [Rhodobacter sp.]